MPVADFQCYDMNSAPCICCGTELNACSALQPGQPAPGPGDTTVCMHCLHIYVWADDMSLREPSDCERAMIVRSPEYREMLAVILAFHAAEPSHFVRH